MTTRNALYYGDNLNVLRESIASESVDLVYLDPPFNSQATYNLLFRSPAGQKSQAQVEAFEDTWHWTIGEGGAADAFEQVIRSGNTNAADLLRAMRQFLGDNDMMAYLAMMAIRLIELRRALKPTGTLYLHCDSTASHYLKILLDGIFGPICYRNEIIWKRSNPKSLGSVNLPACTDAILRYSKGSTVIFHQPYEAHDPDYVESAYKYSDERGIYRLLPLLNPNDDRPNLTYEFLGVTRVWRWTKERMQASYDDGLVVQLKPGAVPQYKKYLHDSKGRTITNCWIDIPQAAGNESIGYPTQKPLALLSRIISMSSNEGDLVLDPFCGCGTAIHAAQKLGRSWLGIDITHLAISLIERRLKDAFPGIAFEVHGTPKDLGGARDLAMRNKYQFQWWALSLIEAQPYAGKKKGADSGIDGLIYFRSDARTTERAIVSVKGGDHVSVPMVRDLKGVLDREKAPIGVFLTLTEPTRPMEQEAASAGFYTLGERQYPRIQIITIEQALKGMKPAIPLVDTGAAFKRAARESASGQTKMAI
jgi:site-specific DNA-methyltransferase (adenine-specific)